ncbi:MAG: hypothetical protein HYS13_14060 [Planctomycetia bacterium]|nr:hypothetical protein [Planctomycetia bacterium]
MNHIPLEQQDDAVRRFVLSLPVDPNGSVLELNGRAVAWVVHAVGPATNGDEPWTEEKNQRRCDLIDRKYGGALTPAEAVELVRLQEEMLRYRQRVAPLPVEHARRLHQELLAKAAAWTGE